MDKHIAGMKKPHHNIYGLHPLMYKIIVALCIALWWLLFLDVHIRHLSRITQVSVWIVTLVIVLLIAFIFKNRRNL